MKVQVSDHAVLRYLERVGGFEIEALRADIARTLAAQPKCGEGVLPYDGAQFVLRPCASGLIVTTVVLPRVKTRLRPFRERLDD